MFSLYGQKEVLKNLYILSEPFSNTRPQFSDDLRLPYLDFLEKTYPAMPINRSEDVFIASDAIARALAEAYSGSTLDDLSQQTIIGDTYTEGLQSNKQELARSALFDLLKRNGDFQLVFLLVVHSIFITRSNVTSLGYSSHGGSASGAIGCIWLSMHKKLLLEDIMELYVHELAHHLLFLDELVHGHFNYKKIQLTDNFAYSSILNRSRPLDKVVHSMVVATEVVLARNSYLGNSDRVSVHPDSKTMLGNVLKSYESIIALPEMETLVTPRVIDLIELCYATCSTLLTENEQRVQNVQNVRHQYT